MHAIQRHNDPCDNHDGAFDTELPKRRTREVGSRGHTFETTVEISDGIEMYIVWDTISCAVALSHLYADGEREVIVTQLFKSLGDFLAGLGGPDVSKKVKTAIRATLKAQKDG